MAIKKKFPYRSAVVACHGIYSGEESSVCRYGCTGCSKCIEVCKFSAIAINQNGVAEVDEEKCMACGRCVKVCPGELIHIHDCANYIVVKCSNKERGKEARAVCERSCIGCGLCEKTCTAGAISVVENCAVIDESICLSCGMCVMKCSRNAIVDLRGIYTF